MDIDPKVHHCSQRIATGSLDFVLDLFTELGFEVLERSKENEVAWIIQKGSSFVFQFVESDQTTLSTEIKYNSHIGFISENPKHQTERIKQWIQSRGVKTAEGGWTEQELWLDCPEIFIDFVLEIMHKSIAGE